METLELGHFHSEDAVEEIKQDERYGELIEETFTDDEIKERLQKLKDEHPEMDLSELVEYTKEDLAEEAEHFRHH